MIFSWKKHKIVREYRKMDLKMGEGDSMKNRIISVVLSFFVIVNIILIACAFNVTPLTIKRDTFVYEYGSEIST